MSKPDPSVLKLKPGEVIVIGKTIYARCAECESLVRVNKPIFGGLHVCR